MLPEWLKEEQRINIGKGKDHFLIRNRKKIDSVLLKLRDKSSIKWKRFLHPVTYLLCFFFSLLGVSFSRNFLFFWILFLFLLGLIASLPYVHLVATIKKSILLLLFPFLLYLPNLFLHGFHVLFLLRLPLMSMLIALYTELMSTRDTLQALKKLHFPNIVLLQLDITIKYIYLFGRILQDMLKGIEARSFGGNLDFQIGNNIWGILYLRAVRYGKDLQKAMEARGFTGEYKDSEERLRFRDYLCIALVFLCIVAIRIEEK